MIWEILEFIGEILYDLARYTTAGALFLIMYAHREELEIKEFFALSALAILLIK